MKFLSYTTKSQAAKKKNDGKRETLEPKRSFKKARSGVYH
jgi:hypothetical protein